VTADALVMRWTTDIMLPFWTIDWLWLRAGRGRWRGLSERRWQPARHTAHHLARANPAPGSGALRDFAET
jgi:hypothetical protein